RRGTGCGPWRGRRGRRSRTRAPRSPPGPRSRPFGAGGRAAPRRSSAECPVRAESSAPATRSCRVLALRAEHLHPDRLLARVGAVLADDLALIDDEDAVGERQDLNQLERDEQDRAALVAFLDEPTV